MLREGYARCRELTKRHGTTYYWGARLLPSSQRVDVYAVYALCRLADDIVDEPETVDVPVPPDPDPGVRLRGFEDLFVTALREGGSSDPVMAAVVDSLQRRGTDPECFDRFFRAMELDLTRETWATWEELRDGYMEGSAAVIGEMMLPVLEPHTGVAAAMPPARSLGLAFQLTNFLRDVGEDLDRGRVYLPQDDLARHGADPHERRVTPAWRAMMAEQIERNRELYRDAARGVPMLPTPSARCVATALRMYSLILDRIEQADYDVFSERRRVLRRTKVAILTDVLVRGPERRLPGSGRP